LIVVLNQDKELYKEGEISNRDLICWF